MTDIPRSCVRNAVEIDQILKTQDWLIYCHGLFSYNGFIYWSKGSEHRGKPIFYIRACYVDAITYSDDLEVEPIRTDRAVCLGIEIADETILRFKYGGKKLSWFEMVRWRLISAILHFKV